MHHVPGIYPTIASCSTASLSFKITLHQFPIMMSRREHIAVHCFNTEWRQSFWSSLNTTTEVRDRQINVDQVLMLLTLSKRGW